MRKAYIDAVLALADLIPAGRVLAYGDIAELLGAGGPRQVGAVFSRHGGQTSWWRVIRASGEPPSCHESTALAHYLREGTPLRGTPEPDGSGYRVRIERARWQPDDGLWDRIAELGRLARDTGGEAVPEARQPGPGRPGPMTEMSVPRDGVSA